MGTTARDILNTSSLTTAPLIDYTLELNHNIAFAYTNVMTYPCAPFSTARAGATFSLIVVGSCFRRAPMSPLGPNEIRHRRVGSQKLNPFPKIPRSKDGLLSAKSPSRISTTGSQSALLTWLTLSPSERDILVLSTVIKVLLFPA